MKIKSKAGFLIYLTIAFIVSITAFSHVFGQFPTSNGPTADRNMSESERDLEERIAYQRWLATLAERRSKKVRDPKLALEQLQKDFKGIQATNLEMVKKLSQGGSPDLKFFAQSADEIKKFAARLKTNLALPEIEKDEKKLPQNTVLTVVKLKVSILNLGKLVYNFVKSPLFQQINVVDPNESLKVHLMLNEIIELSESIKKNCEHLKNN